MVNLNKEEPVFTVEQIGELLGVNPQTVRRWINQDKIKGKYLYDSPRLGFRVKQSDLIAYLRRVGEEDKAVRIENTSNGSDVLN